MALIRAGGMMQEYGIVIGVVLLAMVTAVAFALASKAARGVEQFREEHHVHFTGRKDG
jgi:hypothetical protein